MRIAATAAVTALALVSLSPLAHAELTSFDVLYDYVTANVRMNFGVLAELVEAKQDAWLSRRLATTLAKVDAELDAGNYSYIRFNDDALAFDSDALAHNSSFKHLTYDAQMRPHTTLMAMSLSPDAYTDFVFDTADEVASTLSNATLTAWLQRERAVMETRVDNGTSAALLAAEMDVFEAALRETSAKVAKCVTVKTNYFVRRAEIGYGPFTGGHPEDPGNCEL